MLADLVLVDGEREEEDLLKALDALSSELGDRTHSPLPSSRPSSVSALALSTASALALLATESDRCSVEYDLDTMYH